MKNRIVSISLVVALILGVGVVGCGGDLSPDIPKHKLTVSGTDGGDSTCVPSLGCTCGEGTESSGGLSVPEECLCAEGTEVTVEANPDPGYRFIGWTGDVETIADVKAATTTITMEGNCTITANFETIPPAQYSLSISSTAGGSVTTPGEGTFPCDDGIAVSLVATPGSGYRFVGWTGNVQTIADVNAAMITITMNDDYSIVANFEAIRPGQYSLTISSTTGGSVSTPGQGTFWYDAGAVVDLVTESEEGYKFFNWTGDIETMASFSASSSTKHNQPPMHFWITMEGNYAITAHFIPRWYVPTG